MARVYSRASLYYWKMLLLLCARDLVTHEETVLCCAEYSNQTR